MMAARQPGRRAERHRTSPRRPNIWWIGLLVGLVGGGTVAWAYPAPSVDVIKIEAADWYDHMRDILAPGGQGTGSSTSPTEPQIYAGQPVEVPPEPDTDEDLSFETIAELVNVNAPKPEADVLAAELDDAIDDSQYANRVTVADVATGEVLYEHGGADAIVPASTLKLFTAVSALEQLGADHRFVTSAGYDPDQGVVLIGGGDGLLSTGESTGETVGYAGLADLAEKTWDEVGDQFAAEENGTIDVWADVSRYEPPSIHPTWNESLMAAGWVSPVYPMNTYGGFYSNPLYDNTAVEDGAAHAGGAYAQQLTALAQADGQDLEFRYAGQQAEPTNLEPVAEMRSAPLRQQLEYAMKQSNNMLLEIFGREAAIAAGNSADFDGSTATTIATVNELGISTEHLEFVDNSGLSPNSRATLNSMVQLYEVVLAEEHLRPLLNSLTIAGYDGTMRYRLAEAPYSGVVRSKTGTLEVASSNAGMTVTADGRALWFAINTSGAGPDYDGARAEQDRLTEIVTDCGCSGQ